VGASPDSFDFPQHGGHVSPIRTWLPIYGRWLKGSKSPRPEQAIIFYLFLNKK